jgi:hypothetical protein
MGKSSSAEQDDQKEPAAQTSPQGKKKQPHDIPESTDSTSQPEITSTSHTSEERSNDGLNVGDLAGSTSGGLVAPMRPSEGIPDVASVKNPAAVSLGRLGGLKGGKARAQRLTKTERSEAARKAARARWQKKEQTK